MKSEGNRPVLASPAPLGPVQATQCSPSPLDQVHGAQEIKMKMKMEMGRGEEPVRAEWPVLAHRAHSHTQRQRTEEPKWPRRVAQANT